MWLDLHFRKIPSDSLELGSGCPVLKGGLKNQGRSAGDASWVLLQVSVFLRVVWFPSSRRLLASLSWTTKPTHSCTALAFCSLEETLSVANNLSLYRSPVQKSKALNHWTHPGREGWDHIISWPGGTWTFHLGNGTSSLSRTQRDSTEQGRRTPVWIEWLIHTGALWLKNKCAGH